MLTPNGAEALAATGPTCRPARPRTARSRYVYFTFNFGKDGWNEIPDAADEIREITAIDGVDVYLGGYGGQAADSVEAFDGIDTQPAPDHASAWSS